MPRRTLPGRDVEVDESGFLVDALAWTPEIAEELARATGFVGLTPRHWRVLLCCREAAARDGSAPDLCAVSRLAGLPPAELERLFRRPSPKLSGPFDSFDSGDPFESLTRIAGLPKPPKWIDVP
jgi:tRNA 2-thiouridine synthesizing protein E